MASPCSLNRGGARAAPPRFNEHGEAILAAHGYSEDEIAKLADLGVVVRERR
jgi:formyl-CoA transferase